MEITTNQKFSKLYSTILDVNISLSLEDLYLKDNFTRWLEAPNFWLYLWSNSPWSGKTSTRIRLCRELYKKDYKVLALSLIDYKNMLKKEFWVKHDNANSKSFYDRVYSYDFILLDDISYHVSWEWTNEVLKDLFDRAFNFKNPKIIITSQMAIKNLPLPEAIKSRIMWTCHEIQFPEKDYRKETNFKF
jgi:DNA replication protein DnaC